MIMNFWQEFSHKNFDELFNNPDLSLEEVLENEEVILQLRNHNPKLLTLYTQYTYK
jgi:hypothetical protein